MARFHAVFEIVMLSVVVQHGPTETDKNPEISKSPELHLFSD